MDRSYRRRKRRVYWSMAMFFNVHLTQGRADISLLLQPLSFSLRWLIHPTPSISRYNILNSVSMHHRFVPFSTQNHLINLHNLSAYCLCVSTFHRHFFFTLLRNRTNEVHCVCDVVVCSHTVDWWSWRWSCISLRESIRSTSAQFETCF